MKRLLCGLAMSTFVLAAARAQGGGMPEVGKPAPAIDLPATSIGTVLPDKKDARKLSLKDLQGKNVVLFFYPKALTGG